MIDRIPDRDPANPGGEPAAPGGEPAAPGGEPAAPGGEPAVPDGQPAAPVGESTEVPPAGLWDRMRADPQYAPEHLALEAVRRLGPEAHRWAEGVRARQPGIDPEQMAELAAKKFRARARLSGAVSGAAGLPGAIVDVGVLAWTQARMVLHMAAAHGHDPTHPERATDLLVLQRVHKVAEAARLALGVASGRAGARPQSMVTGRVMVALGVRLARMAGLRAAKRMFAKVVPGAAIILGTWANSTATTDLARRTGEHYRARTATRPGGTSPVPAPRRSDDQPAGPPAPGDGQATARA